MITPEIKLSVLDYLGSVGSDVLSLLSLVIGEQYFEICYFYGPIDGQMILSDELENKIKELSWDIDIEELEKRINNLVLPYSQAINIVDEYKLPTREEILSNFETKPADEINPELVKKLD